jgi:hypothetical protein
MPYYLYEVMPYGALHCIAEFEQFREASAQAKARRAERDPKALGKVKIIFAANALEAEDLLCRVREPGEIGGDDD